MPEARGRRPLNRLAMEPVRETVVRLELRIVARFPDRDLRRVAQELVRLADDVAADSATAGRRSRPVRTWARLGIVLVLLAAAFAMYLAATQAISEAGSGRSRTTLEWLPLLESGINDLIFVGIAVYFLVALPGRVERNRLLPLLHRLRSLAHIVDMHQLTKDPERLRPDFQTTSASVEMNLDRDAMEHYLDYCSELLSLIGKVAALCAEESTDPVVLDTVSTIETLTTGMSRKIWQKISLLPP